jgi:putative transposase
MENRAKLESPAASRAERNIRRASRGRAAHTGVHPAIIPVDAAQLIDGFPIAERDGKARLVGGFATLGNRFRPFGPGLDVSRPFERVEIGEFQIDPLHAGFKRDELEAFGLTGEQGRWWIVAAIDCRTRLILGVILTREPKASAAVACLRMITSDKGAISDAAGAAVRWSQCGAPELLVADDRPAFKAIDFTAACNDIGVTLERTIAGRPAMRGTVERFFSTCATNLASLLWGGSFSNVIERSDHSTEVLTCLKPEDLSHVLVRRIVDIYHNTPHTGLGGLTPLQQWEKDLGDPGRLNVVAPAGPAPHRSDDA